MTESVCKTCQQSELAIKTPVGGHRIGPSAETASYMADSMLAEIAQRLLARMTYWGEQARDPKGRWQAEDEWEIAFQGLQRVQTEQYKRIG